MAVACHTPSACFLPTERVNVMPTSRDTRLQPTLRLRPTPVLRPNQRRASSGSSARPSFPGPADIEPAGGLTIDCDCCALRNTNACDDCVVSFLLEREPDDAVVIDADEARAMRMLERAGLVPTLRFSTPGRLSRPRGGGGVGEAPPARHQRLPAQGRGHPELPLGSVEPARPVLVRGAHRLLRRGGRRLRRRAGRAGHPHRACARPHLVLPDA